VPRVSVLLTSYHHQDYLKECICSALEQTFRDYEIIAVDDASQDASPEILQSLLGGHPQAQLILHKENRGTYPSLNEALARARGEYAAILNSDDVWLPEKLERQVALMQADPDIAFCHTSGWFINDKGERLAGKPMGFAFPEGEREFTLADFVRNNCAIASSVMFRVSWVRDLGGFDESFKNLGDWDMWLKLAEKGKVGFVPQPLTLYRIHSRNTIYFAETTFQEDARIREKIRARKEELLALTGHSRDMRLALAHNSACLGNLYSVLGKPSEARRLFWESLRLYPYRFKSLLRIILTFAPPAIRRRLM
jgi:glycosyltransferase involved in cell wall biosynthesis